MEELVCLLRVYRRKKDLWTRKCHCKREKDPKNQLLRVWEEEKAVPDTHIAMQAGKTPEIFEEQVCGNRKKPSKGYRQDK